jgi:hypothetical protein
MMTLHKEVKESGMPWEEQYGYAQAVKVDDTIYVSDHGEVAEWPKAVVC